MSLMGWLSGLLERDRRHRQAIADGARLRTRHARTVSSRPDDAAGGGTRTADTGPTGQS